MSNHRIGNAIFSVPSLVRRGLLSWLTAVTAEYFLLPTALKALHTLDCIASMSSVRVLLIFTAAFTAFSLWNKPKLERWFMSGIFAVLAALSLSASFTWPFLICVCLILVGLLSFAFRGWNYAEPTQPLQSDSSKTCRTVTAVLAVLFFLFVSIWTVSRVFSFSTPTYDFGIFSQMFYNMKACGLPLTTLERDGLLSHFYVHVSPIYYLLLPFYCLFPKPATLQILQAAVLASAVIPLWLIGKRHGLCPVIRTLLCALLLFYPAYSGGTSYDLHENAFLTPLILWLFYSLDRKSFLLSLLFAVLTLSVKEDAAVYVAVVVLYYLVCGILNKDREQILTNLLLFAVAVCWFIIATGFLTCSGDGVMTYRYSNFMYDASGSLLSVIKAVLLCPMKALYECVDPQKLKFIGLTILPLAGIPLFTRRYQRYILLIPYVLVNLMSDYQYQHSIFFQYTFGSTACLFYLTAVNLADLKLDLSRIAAVASALLISTVLFADQVLPKATAYPERYWAYRQYYNQVEDTLSLVPDQASVSATTFYTTYLSQRQVLYDIQYASPEHILSTEYIVLCVNSEIPYRNYAVNGDGLTQFIAFLESNGYRLIAQMPEILAIYQKSQ